MRAISQSARKEKSNDPFYKQCCVPKCPCTDIEWHHPLTFAGKQIANVFVPLCKKHHRGNGLGSITQEGRDWSKLWAITLFRELLTTKYPKYDWLQEKRYLENKLKNTL